MSLLELRNISKSFQGVAALGSLDFRAEAGTVTSIIGPNGAGKTTCLNIISGFVKPDEGAVLLDGRDITGMQAHGRFGLGVARSFQQSRVFTRFSVLENLLLGYRSRLSKVGRLGTGDREFHDRATEALERVGLAGYEETRAEFLSNAEQRRLEVARALIQDPRIVLLDEPTSGLDAQERESLREDIEHLKTSGICVVLVEHHVPFVKQVSDWIAVLDFGRLIATGAPADIERDEDVVRAYLGSAHA